VRTARHTAGEELKEKNYDRYGITKSRNAEPGKEIGGTHPDRDRADSAGPDVSGVWTERLPELHAPTEGHATGNHHRDGGADEGWLYDGGFECGSAHRGAAPNESFRPAGAGAARADYGGHPHVSHLHGAGDNCPWHRRYSDGTLSRLGVSQVVPTAAPGENNSGSELTEKAESKNSKTKTNI